MPEVEVPGVKSRPDYAPVQLQPLARLQLFIGQPAGEAALTALSAGADPALCRQFTCAGPASSAVLSEALPEGLLALLHDAPLATAIYLAGDEPFLWDMRNLLRDLGFTAQQIVMLPPFSQARRLFCTHCYTLTEGVTHSPAVCSGCQRPLLVRDHFSRLHGAYVGVQINAEDPTELPQEEPLS